MRIPRPLRAAALLALPAALLVACSTAGGPPATGGSPAAGAGAVQATTAAPRQQPSATPAPEDAATPGAMDTPPPVRVRDAFAGLQATLGDGCTTEGQCAYFLGRVYDELEELDRAMKADPKGPGHFPEPIEWITGLRTAIGTDLSYPNLRAHQDELLGTRDRINTWMQDHPDDYR
ncbi:hypothetical protein SSP531S_37060 [Streptomyces spongiicola]|uniref:Lipoprotein n=1 Tax=Streptomyces spongiicola TaxID=1690221 RepID=A0A2S1Z777_9ACTN|nr:hypothetical protein [Streptomyces spongiicola]AWK12180.1 hypothetical protein DDQ41_28355 [Streptomyces spongiicola]GBQ02249.1 hypothetical protein SSP531S_37060 [Streptomyces spongiicola]